jgi:putative pyruvate formate lyase activating enzyme
MSTATIAPYPSYLELYESGELARRVEQARQHLAACTLCPRACQAQRLAGERGECGTGRQVVGAFASAHFGEERVLRGYSGSGTVFFSGCNLHCVFCQNHDISQEQQGMLLSAEDLAGVFLGIQRRGCHNLNLVTPSHIVAQFLEALLIAVENGFRLPIVYNTSAYDAMPTLRLLDGIVDIYMPDVKYADSETASLYSGVPHYWEVAARALQEMQRQVGVLRIDEHGLARRGVLIRHLILPNDISGTEKVLHFIANQLSPDSWVNLMAQYRPAFRAGAFPRLRRPITTQEYTDAVQTAQQVGLHRGIPFDNMD